MKYLPGLRRHYLFILLFSAFLLAGLFLLGMQLLRGELTRYVIESNNVFAAGIRHSVERMLRTPGRILTQLAGALTAEPEAWAKQIETRRRIWPYFESIQILDRAGIVRHNIPADAALTGNDFSATVFFRGVRETGRIYWSPVFLSATSGQPTMTVALPFAGGVLAGNIRLDELSHFVGELDMQDRTLISIVDRNGTYIFDSDPARVSQRATATRYLVERTASGDSAAFSYEYGANGTNWIVSARRLPETGWSLLVARDREKLFAPVADVSLILLPLFLFVAFYGYVALRRISTRMLQCLDEFGVLAGEIADGHYTPVPTNVRFREFEALAAAFDEMRLQVFAREQQIIESEERYRMLVEHSPEGIVVTHEQNFVFANPAALAMFRAKNEEELRASRLAELVSPPDGDSDPSSGLRTGTHAGQRREAIVVRLDGSCFDAEISSMSIRYRDRDATLSVIGDVSERRRIERELDEMNARFRNAIEATEDGLWDKDLTNDKLHVSPRYCRIFGYDQATMPSRNGKADWKRLIHPDDRDMVERKLRDFLGGKSETLTCEMRMQHKNGQWLWILSRGRVVLRTSAGQPLRVMGTIMDMTARRGIEAIVEQERHNLETLVNSIEGVVWEARGNPAEFVFVSERLQDLLGYPPAHWLGSFEAWKNDIHPEDRASVLTHSLDRTSAPGDHTLEYRLMAADDRIVWVRDIVSVYHDNGRTVLRGILVDVTASHEAEEARLRLESQLRQEQKLSSIGTLASGVAHEINNPLMSVINYAQLIEDRLAHGADPEVLRGYSSEIISEWQRISTIVRNLLAFSRQSGSRFERQMPSDIIESIMLLTRKLFDKDEITTSVRIEPDLPPVKCNRGQIQQVLLNLLTNARDALNMRFDGYAPEKTIEVDARMHADAGRRWIRFSITDNGYGVPGTIADRIFDPFFTTKSSETGTGLGLSISYGIIKDHGGELGYDNRPGGGCRFHFALPVFETLAANPEDVRENQPLTDGT